MREIGNDGVRERADSMAGADTKLQCSTWLNTECLGHRSDWELVLSVGSGGFFKQATVREWCAMSE